MKLIGIRLRTRGRRSLKGLSLQHPRWRRMSLGERSLCEQHPRWRRSLGEGVLCEQHPRWRRSLGERSLCEQHPRFRRTLGAIAHIMLILLSLSRDADPAGTAKHNTKIPSCRWQVWAAKLPQCQRMGRIGSAGSLEARLGGFSKVGRTCMIGPVQAHGVHSHGVGRRRSLCRPPRRRRTRRRRGGRRPLNPWWRRVSAV